MANNAVHFQLWLPENVLNDGVPAENNHVGDQADHHGTPEYWFRRSKRLQKVDGEWTRPGRLIKVSYD